MSLEILLFCFALAIVLNAVALYLVDREVTKLRDLLAKQSLTTITIVGMLDNLPDAFEAHINEKLKNSKRCSCLKKKGAKDEKKSR